MVYILLHQKRIPNFSRKTSKNSFQGTNPLSGIILDYYLPEVSDSLNITLEIIDGDEVIRTYSSVKENQINHGQVDQGQKKYYLKNKDLIGFIGI